MQHAISRRLALLLCVYGLVTATTAKAQTVVLSGILGQKALLVVDGTPPKSVAVGETYRGVKLLAAQGQQAEVDIGGQHQTLRMGEGPVSAEAGGDARRIVLHASSHGHFLTQGQINGKTVNFVVDTGASVVSMSVAEAEAIGLPYQSGDKVRVETANGTTVGWRIQLATVHLGSVDIYGVEALVTPTSMPYVLLGNSYLTRFQMTRINDELVLEQRY